MTTTATCVRGHATGSRPHPVPVIGTGDFVVYHGSEYLDAAGAIVRHPVRLTSWDAAQAAITAHDAELPELVRCSTCGMRADADPELHAERYGHWPTVRGTCGHEQKYGNGATRCATAHCHAEAAKPTTPVYAMGREETEACQAGTDGCCIDHTECDYSCECW